MSNISMRGTTAPDPICGVCGRPVVGLALWGANGPYHPECVGAPQTRELGYTFYHCCNCVSKDTEIARLQSEISRLRDAIRAAGRLADYAEFFLPAPYPHEKRNHQEIMSTDEIRSCIAKVRGAGE